MKSEALRTIRTMRQVKSSLDVARNQRPRTTNSLSKTREEIECLESLIDRQLEQILQKERGRFAAQETSIGKSRQRLLRARERLAKTVNKNRALTELKLELQRARWRGDDPIMPPPVRHGLSQTGERAVANQALSQIELRY